MDSEENYIHLNEYKRKFETEHSVAEVKNHPTDENKLEFTIDGVSDNWFKQKQKEFLKDIEVNLKEPQKRSRGIGS